MSLNDGSLNPGQEKSVCHLMVGLVGFAEGVLRKKLEERIVKGDIFLVDYFF